MRITTAEAYLNAVRNTERGIKVKREELYQLQLIAVKIDAQTVGERVQSSNTKDFTKTIDKIICLQTKINEEIQKLVDLKAEAREKINQLEDERFRAVLTEYYINHKTWEQVAEDVHYSNRQVYRLHGLALQTFKEKFGFD